MHCSVISIRMGELGRTTIINDIIYIDDGRWVGIGAFLLFFVRFPQGT